jgi:histidinol dehydrogenase
MCLKPWTVFVQVGPICENVQKRGDAALKEYTAKFDGVNIDNCVMKIEVSLTLIGSVEATFYR